MIEWLLGQLPGFRHTTDGLLLLIIFIPSAVSVFAVAMLRDLLLRRRIRYLIVNRGSCSACGYVLLGLPVSEANTVACPECGHISDVDPAMGELAVAADGARTYRSSGHVAAVGFWNPKRVAAVTRLAKWAGLSAVVLAFMLGGAVIWRYVVVEQDASKAAAMLNPAKVFGQHVLSLAPKGVLPGEPNGWAVLMKLGGEIDDHCTDARAAFARTGSEFSQSAYEDFSLLHKPFVFNPGFSEDEPTQRRLSQACKQVTEDAMRRIRATDVIARIDSLAGMGRYEPEISSWNGGPQFSEMFADVRPFRSIDRIMQARLALAIKANELDEAVQIFESALRIANLLRRSGLLVHFFAANSAELGHIDAILPLVERLTDDGLRRVHQALAAADSAPRITDAFDGNRLLIEQELCEIFSDAGAVRWGVASEAANQGSSLTLSQWWKAPSLGRLNANLAAISAMVNVEKGRAAVIPIQRAPSPETGTETSVIRISSGDALTRNCKYLIGSNDRVLLMRDGLRLLVALERYRRAHGTYPITLDQLVPDFITRVAIDPWSGRPLVYRLLSSPEAAGRPFVLYSVGADGIDDGGRSAGANAIGTLYGGAGSAAAAGDFVISDTPEWGRWSK